MKVTHVLPSLYPPASDTLTVGSVSCAATVPAHGSRPRARARARVNGRAAHAWTERSPGRGARQPANGRKRVDRQSARWPGPAVPASAFSGTVHGPAGEFLESARANIVIISGWFELLFRHVAAVRVIRVLTSAIKPTRRLLLPGAAVRPSKNRVVGSHFSPPRSDLFTRDNYIYRE